MKQAILDAIKSDPEIRKTLDVLKSNQPGEIYRRYDERCRKLRPADTTTLDYIFSHCGFSDIKYGLQFGVDIDIAMAVSKKVGKIKDEREYKICLFEALDELGLSQALTSMENHQFKNVPLHPLPHDFERVRPLPPMKW